jgi:ribonuclease P protein component
MVGKQERLTRAEFTRFFACGYRHHSPFATILVAAAPSRKLAVVVGKKVAKSAVCRNTLRRQMYHVLSDSVSSQVVCILILKPTAAQLPRRELQKATREFIGRALKNQ